jgi:hypothetical protein
MARRFVSAAGRACLVVGLLVSLGTAAFADAPRQYWRYTDFGFRSPGASAVCGFDVFVHIQGWGHGVLFFDEDGVLVKEIDTNANVQFTVYAPATGKSFTWRYAANLTQYYTGGGVVGSAVLAIITGIDQHYPLGVNAGRTVYEAVVDEINEDGVPIIGFVDELSESGADLGTSVSIARCDAVR